MRRRAIGRIIVLAVASPTFVLAAGWSNAGGLVATAGPVTQATCPSGEQPVKEVCDAVDRTVKDVTDRISPSDSPKEKPSGKPGPSGGTENSGTGGTSGATVGGSGGSSSASTPESTRPSTSGDTENPTRRPDPGFAPLLRYLRDYTPVGGRAVVGGLSAAVIERASRAPLASTVRTLGEIWLFTLLAILVLAWILYLRLSRTPELRDTLKDAFRLFRPAFAGQAWGLVQALVLTFAVIGLELLRPWPIKYVVDRALEPNGSGPWGLDAGATFSFAAAATILISVLLGIASVRATVAAARVGRRITVRIRRQLFEHLHRLALPFHDESRTGDLLYRLMSDVNDIRDALFESWLKVLTKVLLFFGTAIAMLFVDAGLAVIALLPLPLLAIELVRLSRRLRQAIGDQFRHEANASSLAIETLRHVSLVKAYVAEEHSTNVYAKESRRGERMGVWAAVLSGRMDLLIEVVSGAALAAVVFFGALQVLSGRLTAGTLVVLATYARSLYKPLRKAPTEGKVLSKAIASAGRLVEVLRVDPERFGSGRPAPAFRGDLDVRDVRFEYREGVEALRGLSLDIPAGALVVVQGRNGSGKSTLLSVFLRLLQPDSGTVRIDGEPVESFELESYRSRFAYVPQQIQLFGATVGENIAYGRPDASIDEIESAAGAALFHEVALRLPEGYDQMLGEEGETLSGGEARRLMLARAAVRDARVVLLDEPLAGLDPEARKVVARAIRRLASGRTTIVVSHGPASELRPDMVVRLRDGRVESLKAVPSQRSDVAGDTDAIRAGVSST